MSSGRVTAIFERTATGRVLVSCPTLPGWGCAAAEPRALLACLDDLWRELQIAAYAAAHGQPYDAAHLADPTYDPDGDAEPGWLRLEDGGWRSPTGIKYAAGTPRSLRRDQIARGEGPPVTRRVVTDGGRPIWRLRHDPAAWSPLPGGDWLSPSGRRYRADSSQVLKVIALRLAAGLPVTPPDVDHDVAL